MRRKDYRRRMKMGKLIRSLVKKFRVRDNGSLDLVIRMEVKKEYRVQIYFRVIVIKFIDELDIKGKGGRFQRGFLSFDLGY